MLSVTSGNGAFTVQAEKAAASYIAKASSEKNSKNGENQLYVKVTDCNNEQKYLYYQRIKKDDGYRSDIYMTEITSEPDEYFGYIPAFSEDMPSKKANAGFGAELDKFIKKAVFYDFSVDYYLPYGAVKSAWSRIEDDPKTYNDILKYLKSFTPEYVDTDAIIREYKKKYGKDPYKDDPDYDPVKNSENFNTYNRRYPLSALSFSTDTGYMNRLGIEFYTFKDRVAAKLVISDCTAVYELINNEKNLPITKKALEKAYSETVYSESEWFYIDDTPLYNYLLEYVIKSDENHLENVDQGSKTDVLYTKSMSDELLAEFKTSSKNGYKKIGKNNIFIKLPKYFTAEKDEKSLLSYKSNKKGSDKSDISFFITEDAHYSYDYDNMEELNYVMGSFNSDSAMLKTYYNSKEKTYYAEFRFTATDGIVYCAVCKLNSEKITDEFLNTYKNIFGSISLADNSKTDKKSDAHAKISLSEKPVKRSDKGYELAHGYSLDGFRYYKAEAPAVLNLSFYTIDLDKSYETGSKWYLEKLGKDNLWYTVKQSSRVSYSDNKPHAFSHALDENRDNMVIDLSCYPLLPEGKYRIAKPFWEKGSKNNNQYAAYYEFDMVSDTDFGAEADITAECKSEEYSSSADKITYKLNVNSDIKCYLKGGYTDIEYFDGKSWSSVRKSAVSYKAVNKLYSYTDAAYKGLFSVSTKGFDITRNGKYRLRISLGYVSDRYDTVTKNTDTIYAYFNVK